MPAADDAIAAIGTGRSQPTTTDERLQSGRLDTATLLAIARNLAATDGPASTATVPIDRRRGDDDDGALVTDRLIAALSTSSSDLPEQAKDIRTHEPPMTVREQTPRHYAYGLPQHDPALPDPAPADDLQKLAARFDPMPSAISKPARAGTALPPEPSWPAALMAVALASAVTLGLLLILGKIGNSKPTPAVADGSVAPVIWATAESSAAEAPARPLLQTGPSIISKAERDALALAQNHIAAGDLDAARTILQRAAHDGGGEARVMLAETYDPNVLAAWGISHGTVDVVRARELYLSALALGQDRARRRLQALD